MILLHRISSFAVGAVCALSFASLAFSWLNPYFTIGLALVLVLLLLARLQGWQVRGFQFWHLTGTPVLFLCTSFGTFFLLEEASFKIVLSIFVVGLIVLFVEHIFSFIHLPMAYQPFTLEYLSELLHLLSVFFLSVFLFGRSLFLGTSLWFLTFVFFLALFFIVYSTLWAGKVDALRARPYAFAGAVLMSELFATLSFLPTGYYSNAAFLALGAYVFLGLSRSHAHHKLSKEVLRRYLVVFIVLTLVIILTSQWV